MTRHELLARIPASEFFEWMAFEQIEPFGDRRSDIHFAMIQALVANLFGRKENDPPHKVEDFLLSFDKKPDRSQPPEQIRARMEMLAAITRGIKEARANA